MIQLIYRCDLCDQRTYEHSCYKVRYDSNKKVEFVSQHSPKWDETINGRIVCHDCVKVIQKMGARS